MKCGRLVPGLAADVAVFSRDLLTARPEEILQDTRCDLTIRGGQIVFDRARRGDGLIRSVQSRRCRS